MPLEKGTSKKTVGKNVKELMKSYKKTGKIGTSKPKSKKAAQKQAVAIALSKSRGGNKKSVKKESFDEIINGYLNTYLFEDDASMKPANTADPATREVMNAKKRKAGQTPTQAEVDAYKQGNKAAQEGIKLKA